MGAVGNYPLTVDNSWQYRPQESAANRRINEGAGDAVDAGAILPLVASEDRPPGGFSFLS